MPCPFLVLQHIACEPPGAYEDELRAWGGELHRVEVGVLSVELTRAAADDPVFASAPKRFDALQWHGDTWELPAGAVALARSDAYEQQAFVYKRAYGVQFHLEVTTELATEWGDVPAYARSLEAILGSGALPRLLDEIAAQEAQMVRLARRLFRGWLDRVVAPAGTPPDAQPPARQPPNIVYGPGPPAAPRRRRPCVASRRE
jgi:GMP synthase-like glutamine amidotransferase